MGGRGTRDWDVVPPPMVPSLFPCFPLPSSPCVAPLPMFPLSYGVRLALMSSPDGQAL